MSTDADREAFEVCISGPPYELDVCRWPDNGTSAWPGNYRDYKVDLAWALWQESRAQALAEIAALPAVAWIDRFDAELLRDGTHADVLVTFTKYAEGDIELIARPSPTEARTTGSDHA